MSKVQTIEGELRTLKRSGDSRIEEVACEHKGKIKELEDKIKKHDEDQMVNQK